VRTRWQRRSNPGLSTETRSQPGDAARIRIPPLTFAAIAKAEATPATETAAHDVQVGTMVPTTRAYEEALLAAEVAILADNLDRRYNPGEGDDNVRPFCPTDQAERPSSALSAVLLPASMTAGAIPTSSSA
jgi:hypothetical protein